MFRSLPQLFSRIPEILSSETRPAKQPPIGPRKTGEIRAKSGCYSTGDRNSRCCPATGPKTGIPAGYPPV